MAASPPTPLRAPSAGALLLHAGLTALALAIGLRGCRTEYPANQTPLMAGPADLAPARADLAAARRSLDAASDALARAGSDATPAPPEEVSPLAGLVPRADDPPVALDRFAGRLIELETRSREERLLRYYDMVTRPLLGGFDDAILARVAQALARYITATKAIPWGLLGGQAGGAAESWRQLLEDQDRILREALAQDLPPEKVELLHERFAMPVPGAGEALPSPRLGGTAKDGR